MTICTDCGKPCEVNSEINYFSHEFGIESWLDHSSDCCNAEFFESSSDDKDEAKMEWILHREVLQDERQARISYQEAL